jgi:hypothetical protein
MSGERERKRDKRERKIERKKQRKKERERERELTCFANSLVGVRTSTLGAFERGFSLSVCCSFSTIGRANASVFPVPVRAFKKERNY